MPDTARPTLRRDMGLVTLVATGVCSMIGAAINIMPFMVQRSVPGIGPWVLPAYLVAAIPAVLAGLAYAILASAMPRAGGSYVYASRGLHPYLGFIASFSQWFGLCIAIGVVSYVLVPFLRDIASALMWTSVATALEQPFVRLTVSLVFLWFFVLVNLRGIASYERTLVPLMILMFVFGGVVILAGFFFSQEKFVYELMTRERRSVDLTLTATFSWERLLSASAILFSTFIGFDSIAQAGGEAKNPGRSMPLAIGIAVVVVATFYFLFTAAVYHAVPWQFVASEATRHDVTAPGLLGYHLSAGWTVLIVLGAATALTNDLPAMILAVSRLMFAWAEDGIFPQRVAAIHSRYHTPHIAIIASGLMATMGILGSHLAGSFFLGVDILVISMLVNYFVMCCSVLALPRRNPRLAEAVTVVRSRPAQLLLAGGGAIVLLLFLVIQIWRDVGAPNAWYMKSTVIWVGVMLLGTLIYTREVGAMRRSGTDVDSRFRELPAE